MENMSSAARAWVAKNKLLGNGVELHPPACESDGTYSDKGWISMTNMKGVIDVPAGLGVDYVSLRNRTHCSISSIRSEIRFNVSSEFGGGASSGCGVERVELLAGASLGKSAFYSEVNLKRVKLIDLQAIEDGCFRYCSSLESVEINNLSLPAYVDLKYVFDGCLNLKSVSITGNITIGSISTHSFYECTSLRNLTLPHIDTIEPYGISSCESVGRLALDVDKMHNFALCDVNIECLVLLNAKCAMASGAFKDVTIGELYLPQYMSRAYSWNLAFEDCSVGVVHCERGTDLKRMGIRAPKGVVYYD